MLMRSPNNLASCEASTCIGIGVAPAGIAGSGGLMLGITIWALNSIGMPKLAEGHAAVTSRVVVLRWFYERTRET
jgi:hypothetical protein